MFFKTASRINPQTGELSIYYRLVENFRNALGNTSQRSIMAVGYMDDVSTEELHLIADGLDNRILGHTALIEDSPKVTRYVDHLYTRLVKEKRIDRVLSERKKQTACDWQRIDLNSLSNKDVRELGAEWICLQTLRSLQMDQYLKNRDWSDFDCNLAMAHIVCRTVFPASELKTVRYMQENSSICELLGLDTSAITKDRLYKISHRLFAEKEGLEAHLFHKTNELFDLEDKIFLYDLTNTYYEGSMRESELARRGRSKEKRYDCPLIVLALVVNVEGFIKYSAIYEGNMADCKTLTAMIKSLSASTSNLPKDAPKPIVVIDAGIATEDNLKNIVANGFNYICVSRSSLKKYTVVDGESSVTVFDNQKRPIELMQVNKADSAENTDSEYYLKVTSGAKTIKEKSMYEHFFTRFEEGLALIAKGITRKGGVKKYDKVNRRIGALAQKYPSVNSMYDIHLEKNKDNVCTSMTWAKKTDVALNKENMFGVYFLRTSLKKPKEKIVWQAYNCIREIESTNRSLKTDLDLRPIYHKTDDASGAHLHLGLMAYWVVNTIRHQLKGNGITSDWRELVRIMDTQKCVTTTMRNEKGNEISVRCCSKPELKLDAIYKSLKLEPAPFIRKKSVVLKIDPAEKKNGDMLKDTS